MNIKILLLAIIATFPLDAKIPSSKTLGIATLCSLSATGAALKKAHINYCKKNKQIPFLEFTKNYLKNISSSKTRTTTFKNQPLESSLLFFSGSLATATLGAYIYELSSEKDDAASGKIIPLTTTFGTHELQGTRNRMEDAHAHHKTQTHEYFGVFDGHGGQELAQYAADNLYNSLINNEHFTSDINKAITESFRKTHDDFKKQYGSVSYGTCASIIFIQDKTIISANAGDSRAVLSVNGKAKRLSYDHKPDLPEEKKLIEDRTGFVWLGEQHETKTLVTVTDCDPATGKLTKTKSPKMIPSRVWGQLAVSRALGDYALEKYITPDPYISKHLCKGNEEFIILACDGLWDIIDDQAAVNFVRYKIAEYKKQGMNQEQISKQISVDLTNIATGETDKEINSGDNVTVTIILF